MLKQKTILIIAGPTAVGKTAFAIEVAKHFGTEIISADSRQCFTELNIGVAKPSAEDLQLVKHHFINSHSIYAEVNAAVFEQYALNAAQEIFLENDVAVMVGGTGLYIRAFCEGMDEIPEVDAAIRDKIISGYEANGLDWLQQEVQTRDPQFWNIAEQGNPQRLMRALEVMESTGKSITDYRQGKKVKRPFRIVKAGLQLPRETLYDRINHRVDVMIEQGLIEEVQSLAPQKHLNALQTVGYRELFDHFDGKQDLKTAIEEIKKNTRHYAKRQMTWFRKDDAMQWLAADDDAKMEKLLHQLNEER